MRYIVVILLMCLMCSCVPQRPTLEQIQQQYDDQQRWDEFVMEWNLVHQK